MPQQKCYTIEDLELLDLGGKDFELIEGELRIMAPASEGHSSVYSILNFLLHEWLFSQPLGHRPDLVISGGDTSLEVREEGGAHSLICPDLAIYRRADLAPAKSRRWGRKPPVVAMEILSESNTRREMVRKIALYFHAGCEQVWLIDPEEERVTVDVASSRRVRSYGAADVIEGEGLLEGFRLPVSSLFTG